MAKITSCGPPHGFPSESSGPAIHGDVRNQRWCAWKQVHVCVYIYICPRLSTYAYKYIYHMCNYMLYIYTFIVPKSGMYFLYGYLTQIQLGVAKPGPLEPKWLRRTSTQFPNQKKLAHFKLKLLPPFFHVWSWFFQHQLGDFLSNLRQRCVRHPLRDAEGGQVADPTEGLLDVLMRAGQRTRLKWWVFAQKKHALKTSRTYDIFLIFSERWIHIHDGKVFVKPNHVRSWQKRCYFATKTRREKLGGCVEMFHVALKYWGSDVIFTTRWFDLAS